jgi:hypothetical protein
MNQANAIRNPPVTLDPIDHSPVVESENVNLTFLMLARTTLVNTVAFVFSGFFAHITYDYLLYHVIRIKTRVWMIAHHRLQGPPLDVLGPERFLARHSTKRVFQWC